MAEIALWILIGGLCIGVFLVSMRLRFTIRDSLWLLALIAVAAGWWSEHERTRTKRSENQAKAAKVFEDWKKVNKERQEVENLARLLLELPPAPPSGSGAAD